ncbi:hypothetical protein [Paramuribaculum intestinale]
MKGTDGERKCQLPQRHEQGMGRANGIQEIMNPYGFTNATYQTRCKTECA